MEFDGLNLYILNDLDFVKTLKNFPVRSEIHNSIPMLIK